jgi:yecA family protein
MNDSDHYNQVAAALAGVNADVSAAEAQGMLCGLFCSPNEPAAARWVAQVLDGLSPKGEPAREALEALTTLYHDTQDRLQNDSLAFEPLLPDDEAPLSERAQALGQWCEGFLLGVGLAESHDPAKLPREANEVINDLTEIARIDTDTEADEDSEIAYTELVEYLRAATLLVREHTALPSSSQPAETGAPRDTGLLH